MLAAMLVEILASLAAHWPLRVALDNVVKGKHLQGDAGKTPIALFLELPGV